MRGAASQSPGDGISRNRVRHLSLRRLGKKVRGMLRRRSAGDVRAGRIARGGRASIMFRETWFPYLADGRVGDRRKCLRVCDSPTAARAESQPSRLARRLAWRIVPAWVPEPRRIVHRRACVRGKAHFRRGYAGSAQARRGGQVARTRGAVPSAGGRFRGGSHVTCAPASFCTRIHLLWIRHTRTREGGGYAVVPVRGYHPCQPPSFLSLTTVPSRRRTTSGLSECEAASIAHMHPSSFPSVMTIMAAEFLTTLDAAARS